MAMVRHPICVALEKVQMLSKKKDQENSFHKSYDNPAEKVDSADIRLHTLFQYFTKESFLLIPRVCKRWSAFRTENMWKNRLKRDFDLDTKSLRKQPDNTMKLYKKIYSAKRELFRKAHHFGLKPENLVIQMPCKLSRSFSM